MIVSDIFNDAAEVLGVSDETYVLNKLSDAVQLLANKNDYRCLIGYVDICACSDGRTLALPRNIDVPMAVNIEGKPALFRNQWYEFHLNGFGSNDRSGNLTWTDVGYFPTAMDIVRNGYLVALADSKVDLGKKVRVFGYDDQKHWIRTQDEDGNWLDGFLVPVNIIGDYPAGVITADSTRLFVRNATVNETNSFSILSGANDFVSGAYAKITQLAAPVITPIDYGSSYYLRKADDGTISLHTSRSGALTNTEKIIFTSLGATSQVTLKDTRAIRVQTKFVLGASANLATGNRISFTAATMPTGILAGVDYYVNVIDTTNVTLHPTQTKATNNVERIDVSTAGAGITASVKQDLAPITTLDFAINHNFSTGDGVLAANGTGTLPSPLTQGLTYFVRTVSAKKITLHLAQADAIAGLNPIILTDNGAGTSTIVKQIAASASAGSTSNIQCSAHGLASGDFCQFSTTGVLPTPITQGTVYLAGTPLSANSFSLQDTSAAAVNITAVGSGQLYLVLSRAFTIGFTSQWRSNVADLVTGAIAKVDSTGSLPVATPILSESSDYYIRKIDSETLELFTSLAKANDSSSRVITSRKRTANVAAVTTQSAHGFSNGDLIDLSGIGSDMDGTLATVGITDGGGSYVQGSTVTLENGAGNQATATIDVAVGVITGFTIVDSGSNFVAGEALTLTGGGGTLAVVTVGTVTDNVNKTATSTYNQQKASVTVTSPTEFEYASTGLNEALTTEPNVGTAYFSDVKVTALGSGILSLVFDRSGSFAPLSSNFDIESADYLLDAATIRLATTDTLPTPFLPATDYRLNKNDDGSVSIEDLNGVAITIANIGKGTHDLSISRDFAPTLATGFDVTANAYDDGDSVTVSATTLPTPFVAHTAYYVRQVGENAIELYDTASNARNVGSTAGRIRPVSVGASIQILQTLANIKVSSITKIRKEQINLYINLYCFDDGRDNGLTNLARLYPDEIETNYRRIQLGVNCSWARIRYQYTVFNLYSLNDHIPIQNKQAILLMLRSISMRQKDFIELSEAHEQKAVQYMEEEEAQKRGPEAYSIAFYDSTWTNSHEDIN